MNFGALNSSIRPATDLIHIQAYMMRGAMETRSKKTATTTLVNKRPQSQSLKRMKSFPSSYFSVESFFVLLFLTASLLILPLILPPLPPPPVLLLLLPIVILVVLLILAFMPYDVRNIASSYL